jgi:hypothetical protein
MARPTKLTPEVEERLVHAISVGANYKDACGYAGISYQTFLNWRKRAERLVEQAEERDEETEETTDRFVEFFDRMKKAKGEAAVKWLTIINKAAHRDWRAAAWALERRYPESFNLRLLKPDRIDEVVAPTPTTAPARTLSKDDFDKFNKALEELEETGVLRALRNRPAIKDGPVPEGGN